MSELSSATEKKKFPLIPLITFILLIYFVISNPDRAWNILIVMFSFGMIIFVHELGHFLAAKSVGIKVEQFAIGFGKVLLGWKKTQKGTRIRVLSQKIAENEIKSLFEIHVGKPAEKESDTEYQFRVFPLGGFVKMLGQEDMVAQEKSADPASYMNKTVLQRLWVISAGVIVNIIVGFALFIGIFSHGVDVPAAVVGAIVPDSPAEQAGLKIGDEIIAINGKEGKYQFRDLMLAGAFLNEGQGVDLTVRRADVSRETLTVVPKYNDTIGVKLMGLESGYSLTVAAVNEERVQKKLEEMNVKAGDKIVAVNHQAISHYGEYVEALDSDHYNSTAQTVSMTLERSINGSISQHDVIFPVMLTGNSNKATLLGMIPRLKIVSVQEDSPAAKAGVLDDDIVLQFGLIKNPTFKELQESTNAHNGKPVEMVVLREVDGAFIEKTVTVTPKPAVQGWKEWLARKENRAIIGVTISPSDLDHAVVAQYFEYEDETKLDLPRGAQITGVNETDVQNWEGLVNALTARSGQEVTLRYRMGGGDVNVTKAIAVPSGTDWSHFVWVPDFNDMAGLPLEPLTTHLKADGLGEAIKMGAKETYAFISQTYTSLKGIFTGNVSPKGFMGPIGILKTTYTVAKDRSIIEFLQFMAMINVLIAVFNFLPIPILDGGHAVMLIIEKIKGSPVSVKVQEFATYAGLIMIGSLFLYVTFNDVIRVFTS
jgi:regulator of sigma E protease